MKYLPIEWVLFDLGGVCLEVHQGAVYERFAKTFPLNSTQISELTASHRTLWDDIGSREVTDRDAHELFSTLLPGRIDESALIDSINAELGPEIPDTVRVIDLLSRKIGVGCLSNTNSVHVRKLISAYPFMRFFSRQFFSQELGLKKPDPAIYDKTAELLKTAPETILFLDDRQENVDAAIQCGWRAFTYTGPESLARGLGEYGVVP